MHLWLQNELRKYVQNRSDRLPLISNYNHAYMFLVFAMMQAICNISVVQQKVSLLGVCLSSSILMVVSAKMTCSTSADSLQIKHQGDCYFASPPKSFVSSSISNYPQFFFFPFQVVMKMKITSLIISCPTNDHIFCQHLFVLEF